MPGEFAAGGQLEALAVIDKPGFDARNWAQRTLAIGDTLPITWLPCDDIESPLDDLRHRMRRAGAATFARGEGMWTHSDGVYVACTNGGQRQLGQVFSITNGGEDLQLIAESHDHNLLENADNLTVAPNGDLIVCEDRKHEINRLVGMTPTGELYHLAQNHLRSEWAGACFSPDGSTLFVNIQGPGLTIAITGPWRHLS